MITGLVVCVVSISAAIYIFEPEISQGFELGVYKRATKIEGKTIHNYQQIEQAIRSQCKDTIGYMNATVFDDGAYCSIVWTRDSKRSYTAYIIDPYSNEVVRVVRNSGSFWSIIKGIHVSLLIPKYGRDIVRFSTLLFFFVLISGLWLWYPRRKKALKSALTVKVKATRFRLLYDSHRVLGFYIILPLLCIVLSGLVFGYKWMETGVYSVISDTPSADSSIETIEKELSQTHTPFSSFELLYAKQPLLHQYTITYPSARSKSYSFSFYPDQFSGLNNFDTYTVDATNGKLLDHERWDELSNAQKLKRAEYNIHVGAIGGLPTKIIAFITCLICASLPITGFYIWRRKSKKRHTPSTR